MESYDSHSHHLSRNKSRAIASQRAGSPTTFPLGEALARDRRWLLATVVASILVITSLAIGNSILGIIGAIALLTLAMPVIVPPLKQAFLTSIFGQRLELVVAGLLLLLAGFTLLQFTGILKSLNQWSEEVNWDALSAVGQIAIALVALWVAWQQVRTSVQLTSQQNLITQQQTIDAYFQGISDLVLNEEGQLEDWPLERAIAAGRTAAILRGSDPFGKARVLRFLSVSNLLSPLQRDSHLGRPILDGKGWYKRDRLKGIRVVDLGTMLAGTDLSGTDLRGIDLSDINLSDVDLRSCDLSYANLISSNLSRANLRNADFVKTLLYVGSPDTATPYRRGDDRRDFKTGENTGAIVKGANFSNVLELSEDQRRYICAWGGETTRKTVPGGCQLIPNKLDEWEQTTYNGNASSYGDRASNG
ncbi:MAG: pentapeptide repeat-containing protein, partial [Cyanobacteria bacterium P01_A01_bin.3]